MLDDDAVSCSGLRDWSAEFESLTSRVSSLFAHPKSRLHSRQYLEGLLAPIERKNGWTIAEHVGEKEPKALQRFLNLTPCDADDLRDLNLDYAIENLGDPEIITTLGGAAAAAASAVDFETRPRVGGCGRSRRTRSSRRSAR